MIGVAPISTEEPLGEITDEDFEAMVEGLIQYGQVYKDLFSSPQFKHVQTYIRGLLSNNVGRKNVERVALYGDIAVKVRTLQDFLTVSPWSNEVIRVRHQLYVAETIGEPEGLLIVDGSGFVKQGKESAGVARQYCGATGKIDNCQMGVFLGYVSQQGGTIIDAELYLPKSWFTKEQKETRWERCHIPKDQQFYTKPQLASKMIKVVSERNQLPARWVLADEEFGRNQAFLDSIPGMYWYFCEVPTDTRAWIERPETEQVTTRKGTTRWRLKPGEPDAQTVKILVEASDPKWAPAIIKNGAHGPIVAEVARMRVIEVRNGLPNKEVWLFLRRNMETGEIKYFLCNAPIDTSKNTMARISGSRWPIETIFKEDKGRVGLDEYEVRSFTGWHHHMTLVMLAHLFLVLMCKRQKKKHHRSDPPADSIPPERSSAS